MKKSFFYSSMALLAVVAMTSCDSASKLGKEISGTWTGTPAPMAGNVFTSTVEDTYSFTADASDSKTGSITISSVITAQSTFDGSLNGILPGMTYTCPATSTISGTWTAVDDDDLNLTLDMNSLTVNVDPDAATTAFNQFTGAGETATDSLMPQLIDAIRHELTSDLKARFAGYRNLSDVEVKNGKTLEFEIGDIDYYLTRAGE